MDGPAEAVGEALPDAVADGDGDGDAVVAEGLGSSDAEGEGAGERGATCDAGAVTGAGARVVASGMLSLTSWAAAARSLAGAWYENSATPAAATIATPTPPVASSTVRRERRRGPSSAAGPSGTDPEVPMVSTVPIVSTVR
jgi:hypothetical protein